ncbi:hypothetical protein [Sulfuriroseicoccus oceanibius]|uniref:Uncharacterized protein n=1 Tax=Sulfuriroseicoccus oceanibius TaxID=2707525 RepID=A0A6B3L9R9_9BACT|nr:hypothetical protein [Sulfuriroseicoccus oceanibius]QQL43941.1 hypothetical protein G3M56_008535 [Sulfuriroseicoccus oceanibius]
MDVLLDNIVPIAIILMALLQTIGKKLLDKKEGDAEGAEEFELPDWARPEPEEERRTTPPPPPQEIPRPTRTGHVRSVPQPPPLNQSTEAPATPSALLAQIEAAKRRKAEAQKQRQQAAAKSRDAHYASHSRHTDQKLGWLQSKESLRRAIIAREVLGPPLSQRDDWPESRG